MALVTIFVGDVVRPRRVAQPRFRFSS